MTGRPLPKSLDDTPALGRWISLAEPGRVIIASGKVELGQGITTALAQIAAEALEVRLARVTLAEVDTDRAPNEGFTAGSQSVEVSGAALRLAAAQARAALIAVAAVRLGADAARLGCDDGAVLLDGAPSGLDFWGLAADVDWGQPVADAAGLRPASAYRVVGQSVPRADLVQKRIGGGFIHDVDLPGMAHVRVVRQPFRLARLERVDSDWLARRHPGVRALSKADFLALVSDDEYAVHAAHAEADRFVRWQEVPGRWQPAKAPEGMVAAIGAEPAPATCTSTIAVRYARAHIAHASIGPSCALAQYEAGRLTVWTHSQGVFALRAQIARCLGLDVAAVRVVHAHGAGCYGHNGADDAALDAAIVACALPGRPVRVLWSREDELSRGPLGAAMSAEISAGVDAAGRVAAWAMHVTSAPHAQRPGMGGYANLSSAEAMDGAHLPREVADLPEAAGGGASRNARAIYDFAQEVRVAIDTRSRIRTSSLRSLGAHLNVFAIESAMDELAELAGADPLDFRLRHLSDPRCRRVLAEAAEMSGWAGAQATGEGVAKGLAVARYKGKGAWLAAVAEVTVEADVRLQRLWLAVDAGLLINPEGARSQIEGGAIQAASWSLKEAVSVENDRIAAFGWGSYPILRFSEVPEIETRFIESPGAAPLGAGEAAQGPVAAAIGNAVARALGARVRDLPLTRAQILRAVAGG